MERDDHSGEILDERYRLVRKLAEGGMGAVYLAQHASIGGALAVKLLRSELASTELFFKRFEREARANAAIRHRNIVKVFDAGVSSWGEPYMVMEYLEGESLRDLLDRNGPLPLVFAVELARQALAGLAAAHAAGIIHRDLKPDNLILVYEGGETPTLKIIDFGISKFAPDKAAELTWSGVVLGTARYMSPEQAEGREDIDPRTDLYSMGVVLYHALTGAYPHEVVGKKSSLAEALREPPIPPSAHCPGFPAPVSEVLLTAIATDRDERYGSALEMSEALAALDVAGGCMGRSLTATRSADLSPVLGEIGHDDTTVPARPSAAPAVKRTAKRVSVTEREWVPEKREARRSRNRTIAFVALVVLIVGWGAALLDDGFRERLFGEGETRPAAVIAAPPEVAPTPSPGPPAAPAPEGVLVTVEGAPEGSRVFYDGVLVPMNPFRVERRETIVPLRVEADGYEPFSIAVAPTEDQSIRVEMAPAKAVASKKGGKRGALLDRGAATTGGAGAMNEQKAVIARNKHELKRCYDQALARGDAKPVDDLVVHFRLDVGANGRVSGATLTGNGAAVGPFEQCLEREVRGWFFLPKDSVEKPSVVSFSFAFTTSG